ncbi:unnamed protein product, partial [Symbiodinium pilosum]
WNLSTRHDAEASRSIAMSFWDLICCRRTEIPKDKAAFHDSMQQKTLSLDAKDGFAATSVASTEASPSGLRPIQRFQKCVRKLKYIRMATLTTNCNSQSGSFTAASAVGDLETNMAIDEEFEEVMKRMGAKKRGSVIRPE